MVHLHGGLGCSTTDCDQDEIQNNGLEVLPNVPTNSDLRWGVRLTVYYIL